MLRKIVGVIAGYIFVIAFIIGAFSLSYAFLGTERSYQPGSFKVSMLWIVLSSIIGFVAALFAGFLCRLISRSSGAVQFLAGLFLVLGIAMAVFQMVNPKPDLPREGEVSGADAMAKSVSPDWVNFLNPFIGAIGVLAGGSLRRDD